MIHPHRQRWLIPLIICLVVIIADQWSKQWIVAQLGPEPLRHSIPLIGDWLAFVYLRNTGVAFSMFQDMSMLFTIIAIIICAGALYVYAFHLPNTARSIQISLGLIEGGAIGNILDRIQHGYVIDFIQVGWWPVFNIADIAISCGTALLAIYLLWWDDPAAVPTRAQETQHERGDSYTDC